MQRRISDLRMFNFGPATVANVLLDRRASYAQADEFRTSDTAAGELQIARSAVLHPAYGLCWRWYTGKDGRLFGRLGFPIAGK